jgi:hypothetical protein
MQCLRELRDIVPRDADSRKRLPRDGPRRCG